MWQCIIISIFLLGLSSGRSQLKLEQDNTVNKHPLRLRSEFHHREKRQIAASVNMTNRAPLLIRLEPTFGQARKNKIYIFGESFMEFSGQVQVNLGENTSCECVQEIVQELNEPNCYNDTLLGCVYENTTEPLNVPSPIYIVDQNGTVHSRTNISYTFKDNAIIHDALPLRTIPRGGTRVTVTGEYFNPDYKMHLILTTYTYDRIYDKPQFGPCRILNETQALCISPAPAIPPIFLQSRRRRQVQVTTCRTEESFLAVDVAFSVGNVWTNLTQEDPNKDMCVTYNPTFEQLKDKVYEFKVYEGETQLKLLGERLNYGITIEDYQVFVGPEPCNITRLETSILYCDPPLSLPSDLGSYQQNDLPLLRIYPGRNYEINATVNYVNVKPPEELAIGTIVGGVVGLLVGVALLIGIIILINSRQPMVKHHHTGLDREQHDYTKIMKEEKKPLLDLLDDELRATVEGCHLNSHQLQTIRELGTGHYGKVFLGTLTSGDPGTTENVAVKTIKGDGVSLEQLVAFLKEATLMKDLNHPNVMRLIGILIEDNKPYVIIPVMENGDLKSYVANRSKKIPEIDLIRLCLQVAVGMEFLSSQKIIHRDLRAVNCLVDKDIVVKVADFGLSRDMYSGDYYRINDKARPIPAKWMPPEALEGHEKVTSALDVWSFGVLMWEVFTRGRTPYANVNNYDLRNYLRTGVRLESPANCPSDIYEVMLSCWESIPNSRKTFKELVRILTRLIRSRSSNKEELQTEPLANG